MGIGCVPISRLAPSNPALRRTEMKMNRDRVPHPQLLNLQQVLSRLGVSRSTLYDWMAAGKFPAKIKMGARTAWIEAEVDAWIVGRSEAGRNIKRGEG